LKGKGKVLKRKRDESNPSKKRALVKLFRENKSFCFLLLRSVGISVVGDKSKQNLMEGEDQR